MNNGLSLLNSFINTNVEELLSMRKSHQIHCVSSTCVKIPRVMFNHVTNTVTMKCNCKPQEDTFTLGEFISIMELFNASRKHCEVQSSHVSLASTPMGNVYCIDCQIWMCAQCHSAHINEYAIHQYVTDHAESKCYEHNQQFISFCLSCEENLCKDCVKHHTKSHKFASVRGIRDNTLYYEYKELLNKAKDFLNECENYKNDVVSFHVGTNQELTQNITNEYIAFRIRNEQAITYASMFLTSYMLNPLNYQNKRNLLYNTNFVLYNPFINYHRKHKANVDELINNLFNFFHNTTILHEGKRKGTDASNIPIELDYNITISEHDAPIKHMTLLSDGKLVTCSEDRVIRFYTLTNDYFKCEFTIEEKGDINYFTELPDGSFITCGELQGTVSVKVRRPAKLSMKKSYKEVAGFHGGDYVIKVIAMSNNRFASINMVGEVYIWDSTHFNLITKIESCCSSVSFLQMKGTELIVICSSQTNKVVKKWDTLTYIKQDDDLTDIGCINANALVQVEESMVAIGDIAMIYIVDVVKWRKIKEIRNVFLNGRLVFSLAYAGNYLLYVGCENGNFATINLDCDDDNDVVYKDKKYMHTNSINAIVIKDGKQVITGSSDELIRVWDIVGKKRVIPFTPLPYQF